MSHVMTQFITRERQSNGNNLFSSRVQSRTTFASVHSWFVLSDIFQYISEIKQNKDSKIHRNPYL